MTLLLTDQQLDAICTYAGQHYPNECCGLLMGRVGAEGKQVETVRLMHNGWSETVAADLADETTTQEKRYSIAPEDMLAAMREARAKNLEIVGVFHSHPDGEAIPSECDRRLAWARFSYLIVAVEGEGAIAQDYRSWVLNEHQQFQPEPVVTIATPYVMLQTTRM